MPFNGTGIWSVAELDRIVLFDLSRHAFLSLSYCSSVSSSVISPDFFRIIMSRMLRVFERLGTAGTACEFNQSFVRGEARPARQRRTHAVGVEEDNVLGVPVSEGHQDLVTSRLRSRELHRGIVGEDKAKNCPQILHSQYGRFVKACV
jgi:hypothetical protein